MAIICIGCSVEGGDTIAPPYTEREQKVLEHLFRIKRLICNSEDGEMHDACSGGGGCFCGVVEGDPQICDNPERMVRLEIPTEV